LTVRLVLAVAALVAVVGVATLVRTVRIQGNSMAASTCDGDYWLMRKVVPGLFGKLSNGQVVVYRDLSGNLVVKRIVALSGDVVSIHHGQVKRNGQIISEPYVCESSTSVLEVWPSGDVGASEGETIQEGGLFVLGDNRGASLDSRSYGAILPTNVEGVLISRIWKKYRNGDCVCPR
jgi:signal peptidase I